MDESGLARIKTRVYKSISLALLNVPHMYILRVTIYRSHPAGQPPPSFESRGGCDEGQGRLLNGKTEMGVGAGLGGGRERLPLVAVMSKRLSVFRP